MELNQEQKDILARRSIARVKDYKAVFNTPEGKRVLYDMMQSHYVLQQSFDSDTHKMAYNEGQRAVVWKILHHLKMDVRQLEKIIEEREQYEYANE